MPTPLEIAPIVQDCFNRRDGERLRTLWTDDFRFEGPFTSFSGKDRMTEQEDNLWTAFPDMACEVTTFAATSDRASLVTRLWGTHKGPFKFAGSTLAPSGRSVDLTMSVNMVFRNGQIAGERVFFDTAGFMRQLGLSHNNP